VPVCMEFCILVGTILFVTASVFGLPLEQVEFFENKIRPVLAETCYECHNSVNKEVTTDLSLFREIRMRVF
jgi:hypothetical protein